jgi:hypothetical protein
MRVSLAVLAGVLALLATAGPAHAFIEQQNIYKLGDFEYTVTFTSLNATRAAVTVDVRDANGALFARFTGRARLIHTPPFLPSILAGDFNGDGNVDGKDFLVPRRLRRPFLARSVDALAMKFANRTRGIIAILIA